MANEIYPVSWWGSPVENGWGGIYYDLCSTQVQVPSLLSTTLQARAVLLRECNLYNCNINSN